MSDFLWHKISEKEREEIKKQAKKIMDSFSKKLLSLGELKENFIERDKSEREEGENEKVGIDRKIMFENAPHKNKDFIIAEKKKW
ncbi:Asp-tRNA(Asn)/Glu-tRNA(Gln) amidotransferase GatCAB subunit C [Candidatus Pacearchaeota archaeon]|nr:MAG: Asp-tRNA(Asn)/Glu-tRNA(Gln) amidotransferase GatCAB subunit C [Candidatus Pacearchaeota archaeon]